MMDPIKNVYRPTIAKYVQQQRTGIQSQKFSRYGIGYVLRGRKHIYYGDVRHEINRGELFFLGIGTYYIDDIPEGGKPFEQVVFYYTPTNLSDILSHLNLNYQMEITDRHSCEHCEGKNHASYPAWNTVKNFFNTINMYIRDEIFAEDKAVEKMKATELIYMLVSNPDCCLKSKILDNADVSNENFERTIYNYIFDDVTVEDLAKLCNKSLTSFKKDFKEHFHESPHKWLIKQRLMHSRLLLISTNKPVSVIGAECRFPNTSHYIKLFKKEYGHTPASYRSMSKNKVSDRYKVTE